MPRNLDFVTKVKSTCTPSHIIKCIDIRIAIMLQLIAGGRQLQINNTRLADDGKYTCMVANKAGDTSINFRLSVYG